MSSTGYSVNGGPGRCYPIYKDFSHCVASFRYPNEQPLCIQLRKDYTECVRHDKEYVHYKSVHESRQLYKKDIKKNSVGRGEKRTIRNAMKEDFEKRKELQPNSIHVYFPDYRKQEN
eukprot:TRINITY_DN26518_c0_g1_i1.p1 TRINITY_DN26518_c0_g1~~TRINITY_DN26518_c0_g1_i1.p1  ORF type:complete len:117 (-),score=15.48 TRINITY_DN26518_c0_g1_i1:111-461(-)